MVTECIVIYSLFFFILVKMAAYQHYRFTDTLQQNIFKKAWKDIKRQIIVQNALKKSFSKLHHKHEDIVNQK